MAKAFTNTLAMLESGRLASIDDSRTAPTPNRHPPRRHQRQLPVTSRHRRHPPQHASTQSTRTRRHIDRPLHELSAHTLRISIPRCQAANLASRGRRYRPLAPRKHTTPEPSGSRPVQLTITSPNIYHKHLRNTFDQLPPCIHYHCRVDGSALGLLSSMPTSSGRYSRRHAKGTNNRHHLRRPRGRIWRPQQIPSFVVAPPHSPPLTPTFMTRFLPPSTETSPHTVDLAADAQLGTSTLIHLRRSLTQIHFLTTSGNKSGDPLADFTFSIAIARRKRRLIAAQLLVIPDRPWRLTTPHKTPPTAPMPPPPAFSLHRRDQRQQALSL